MLDPDEVIGQWVKRFSQSEVVHIWQCFNLNLATSSSLLIFDTKQHLEETRLFELIRARETIPGECTFALKT